jgi:hypothetical protein
MVVMTRMQKFALFFVPGRYKQQAIEQSKRWMMTCECGKKWSVWDGGGVRAGAKGKPKMAMGCPNCKAFALRDVVFEG